MHDSFICKNNLSGLTSIIVTLMFGIAFYYFSPLFPGVYPDSLHYFEAAKNLSEFKQISITFYGDKFIPMTHYAPLYSILLSLSYLLHCPLFTFIKFLNLFLFLLILLIIRKIMKNYSLVDFVFVACLMFFSVTVQINMIMALSEPLFIVLLYGSFLFFINYMHGEKTSDLILCAIMVALSILTRYAGFYLVPFLLFMLMLRGSKKTLVHSLVFLFFSLSPVFIWMLRNLILTGNSTNRAFSLELISLKKIMNFMSFFSDWILPTPYQIENKVLLVVILFLFLLLMMIRKRKINNVFDVLKKLPVQLFVFNILFYVLFLITSISLFDHRTPVNHRLLFPLYPSFAILFVVICRNIYDQFKKLRVWLFCLMGLILFGHISLGWSEWFKIKELGVGFTSQKSLNSSFSRFIETLDQNAEIYSSNPLFMKYVYQMNSKYISQKSDFNTKNFQLSKSNANNVYFIYLGQVKQPISPITPKQIMKHYSFEVVHMSENALVLTKFQEKPRADKATSSQLAVN